MLFIRISAAFAVGAASLVATAAEPSIRLTVSDPAVQVQPIIYTSSFATYNRFPSDDVSPAKFWKQANATVASEGMGSTMDMGAPVTAPPAKSSSTIKSDSATVEKATMPAHMGHQMSNTESKPAAVGGSTHHPVQGNKPKRATK